MQWTQVYLLATDFWFYEHFERYPFDKLDVDTHIYTIWENSLKIKIRMQVIHLSKFGIFHVGKKAVKPQNILTNEHKI